MQTIQQMYTDNICVIYKSCGVSDNVQKTITSSNILLLCLEGELSVTIDDIPPLKMCASNMIFIPKGSAYSIEILQPPKEFLWGSYFVTFDLFIPTCQLDIIDMLQFPNRICLQGDHMQKAITAYQNILGCHNDSTLISELQCKTYTLELFCIFLSSYGDQTKIDKYDPRLLEIVSYIGAHFNDYSITLDSLAQSADMHPSSLIRLFKEQTGLTPMQFVNRTRLMAAKRMLLYSNKSIKEIAQETGFGEQQSFVRNFRQDTSLTPSDFRRSLGYDSSPEL